MKLIASGVSKQIRGRVILSEVNLTLNSGAIYSFIGRNGSGKTMLFRALSGLMSIDSGVITWNGQEVRKDFAVLPSLGITIEHIGLFPHLTGIENLRYLAGLNGRIKENDVEKALKRVGLDPKDKRTYRSYSLGMKQRLAIAQAIMEQPDVLMLDEPTNGLDEISVAEIHRIILEEKERGALVLLSSHHQEDIQLLSDHIYRIEAGSVQEVSRS